MLAIFDMSSVNITRYNSDFIKSTTKKYIALVDDKNLCLPINDNNCRLVCSSWWRVSNFIKFFKENNVTTIVISGQRPADLRVLIAANSLSIKVIYKMHGLYIPYMKRGLAFYFIKLSKTFRTLFYLIDIAVFTKKLNISFGMAKSFIFGAPRRSWAGEKMLSFEYGLIWSKYWKSWHEEHWAMNPNSGWIVLGNPDTEKFKMVDVNEFDIVYIYQTLVEDGRIDANIMNKFYNALSDLAKVTGKSVHVKWHPRGDPEVLERLTKFGFLIHTDMPKGHLYIGHYSSLLGLVPMVGGHVVVFELEGHPTPISIKKISNELVGKISDLNEIVKNGTENWSLKKSEAKFYFGDHFNKKIEQDIINQDI